MGAFDREPTFGENFSVGDRFVWVHGKYDGSIGTIHGPAERSYLTIVSRDHPTEGRVYSALGIGIANQCRRLERGDLPQVVEVVEIATGQGDNKVKKLAPVNVDPRAFIDNGEDGPPADTSVFERSSAPDDGGGGRGF